MASLSLKRRPTASTRFLANRGTGVGVRLGVRTSGCSGLAYVLEFVDEVGRTTRSSKTTV